MLTLNKFANVLLEHFSFEDLDIEKLVDVPKCTQYLLNCFEDNFVGKIKSNGNSVWLHHFHMRL